MKLTRSQLKKIITESLEHNSVFMKLDKLYNGSAKDLAQLRMILQSGTLGDEWLTSKINNLVVKTQSINKEIKYLESLPFDPYYHDVTQMEINDLQYDASDIYKEINYLKNLKNKQINEMNRRQRNFNAAQYAYDNMLPPESDRPSEHASEDEIIDYLEEELEDHAEELGLLQSMPHAKALSAAYLDNEEYWAELYDERKYAEFESDAADAKAEAMAMRYDDYDSDY